MRTRCLGCPYTTQPIVPGHGPLGGLVIVGEAPGRDEATNSRRPFTGMAGRLLRATLVAAGVDPEEIYMTNAVACHPPGNKTPTRTIISYCQGSLIRELEAVKPTKILTVGAVGLGAIRGNGRLPSITKERGQGQYVNVGGTPVYCVPTLHPALVLREPDYFRDFAWDIKKWLSTDAPYQLPAIEPTIPNSAEEAVALLYTLKSASVLACDLETTGLDAQTDTIESLGIGAKYDDGSGEGLWVVIPSKFLANRTLKKQFKDMLLGESWDGLWLFHNLKFDLQFLTRWLGECLRPKSVRDTMLLHYCLDERPFSQFNIHGLKDLARTRWDMSDFDFGFKSFFAQAVEDRDYESLYRYHALDLWATRHLSDRLELEALEDDPQQLEVHDNILIPAAIALAEAELHGALVDQEHFNELRQQYQSEADALAQEIQGIALGAGMNECNPLSPMQVRELIYEHLGASGNAGASTTKEVLADLARVSSGSLKDACLKILEYRQKTKFISTYIDGIVNQLGSDGRIRTDIRLHGTSTGRLSSSNPNLQNIPVRVGPTIRRGFVAPDKWYFVSIDYNQLELRVAAWLSGDQRMLEAYRTGQDFHRVVAAQVFGKAPEEISYFERSMAKYINFGILYGRGPESLSSGVEMRYLVDELGEEPWSVQEAKAYIAQYLAGFPELKSWIEQRHVGVLRDSYVETAFGRRRRFPMVSTRTRGDIERKAVNSPIQGTASDINTIALSRVQLADLDGVHVLFPVHDEISFEIRGDVLWRRIWDIIQIMEGVVTDAPITFDVDVAVDLSQPSRWGNVEEVARVDVERRRDVEIHEAFKAETLKPRPRTEWVEEV